MSVIDFMKNKVITGSRMCEQVNEFYGCYVPTNRIGFTDLGRMGPRGPQLLRCTNPPGPSDLKCDRLRNARKVVDCPF